MLRPAAPIKVAWGSSSRIALDAGPDRDRDHVLLQPLLIADAGIAAGGKQIDKTLVRDDLDADIGIDGQEGRKDAWQHEPHRRARHVKPQYTRRPVAEAVDDVECGFHLGKGGSEPIE